MVRFIKIEHANWFGFLLLDFIDDVFVYVF